MKRTAALLLTMCVLLCTCMIGAAADGNKVYALTMGVHKYAANHTVRDGSSIAEVIYVRRKDGTEGSANCIYDIEPGETFTLKTKLKDNQKDFYTFCCWLDINSEIISTDPEIEVVMDSSKAFFAAYVESTGRHVVTYRVADGKGSVSLSSNREIYQGKGCASVLHGASATIKFSPDGAYSTYALTVNGQRVSMLAFTVRGLVREAKEADVKGLFNVLFNYIKYLLGWDAAYTIDEITDDTLIEVRFTKVYLLRTIL